VRFIRPKLVVEVAFRGWSSEGLVRHASFRGLRDDKPAADITDEIPDAG
jgi:bifunctional non-homologous end joining protein LigD